MKQAKPFFGGLPTEPQVKKLRDHFSDIEKRKGSLVTHNEIGTVISESYPSGRYKSIVDRWRRWLERDKGIFLDGKRSDVVGKGFWVMTADEQVGDASGSDLPAASRKVRRAWTKAALAPDEELDDIGRKKRDHVAHESASLIQAHLQSRKAIAAAIKPPDSPPQIMPPQSSKNKQLTN